MDSEDEFEIKLHLVEKEVDGDSCDGCKFNDGFDCWKVRGVIGIPQCSSRYRPDGRNVIFVDKQP